MFADARTMVWKEWTEFLRQRSTIISMLFFVGVFGVFLPFQRGAAWVTSPTVLINSSVFPVMLVLGIVADAFAGERERHTLETLLATRMSDRAILIGKWFALVGYAWGITLVSLLLGVLTVNLTAGHGEFLMYAPRIGMGSVMFSVLGAGMSAGVGCLVSLRAATVREAAQTLSIGMMVIFFFTMTLITALPRSVKRPMIDALSNLGGRNVMMLAAMLLLSIDILLLVVGVLRFQRNRLILD